MPRRLVWPLLLALASGCTPPLGPPLVNSGPLKVATTTSIIADAVREIGGPAVEVTALMPPGTDPHNYVPATGDANTLAGAHVVFFNGLHLEGKMTELLADSRTIRAVAVTRTITPADLRTVDGGGATDPHVWFDVQLWMRCVEVIRDELCAVDPNRADTFRANAAAYLASLKTLHAEVARKAAALPADRRVLVTSHDAFGYFARAYGFEVRGLQGVSTAAQTGPRDVTDLVAFIRDKQVPAIFTETSVPARGLEKVLEQTPGVKLVGDAEALYSDSLGPVGSPGATYPGMVRHNIDTLVKYLAR